LGWGWGWGWGLAGGGAPALGGGQRLQRPHQFVAAAFVAQQAEQPLRLAGGDGRGWRRGLRQGGKRGGGRQHEAA
jgi:hypothetical protein